MKPEGCFAWEETPAIPEQTIRGSKSVNTLIELYDERPLENVVGVEMFQPERVVYICPKETSGSNVLQARLKTYFEHRGLKPELVFLSASVFDTEAMLRRLRKTVEQYPECTLDITGGTDAVLFASGMLCSETAIPVFTYSRKRNRFYNIQNAPFAANIPCNIVLSVEDCFRMAGGVMRTGRTDNNTLSQYMEDIEPFFQLYLKHRTEWVKIITFMQKISPATPDGVFSLEINGPFRVKGERASYIDAPQEALRDMEAIGLISNLQIEEDKSVSFCYRDAQTRAWLRDVGIVLELYVYKVCKDSGLFHDVITSVIVDWDDAGKRYAVSNELDVMCTRGLIPVFISCKTGEAKTEALNELAVLRDRFGGGIARAAIVTAEKGGIPMRNRASELGIDVIDLNDLLAGRIEQRLQKLMRPGK